jgi:Spy/CpxP family protein refolding chaperone
MGGKAMDRKKLLIGVIIFLVLLNAGTILTVLLHMRNSGGSEGTKSGENTADTIMVTGFQRVKYLADQLSLTLEQQEGFRVASQGYGREARSISLNMSKLREELLKEMDKEEPDQGRLDSLSEEIGQEHISMKKLTVKHYLELKSLCTDEQKDKLYEVFSKILNTEGEMRGPRGQGGPPAGAGQGKGPWWSKQKDSNSK